MFRSARYLKMLCPWSACVGFGSGLALVVFLSMAGYDVYLALLIGPGFGLMALGQVMLLRKLQALENQTDSPENGTL